MKKLRLLDLDWGIEKPKVDKPPQIIISEGKFHSSSSISNFDMLFVDPIEISQLWTEHLTPSGDGQFHTDPRKDRGLGKGLENLMKTKRSEVRDLLTNNGHVFCKLRKAGRSVKMLREKGPKEINKYSWLPRKVGKFLFSDSSLFNAAGKRMKIEKTSSPVAVFLDQYSHGLSYEVALEAGKEQSDVNLQPLATSPAGGLVAFTIKYEAGSITFLPANMEFGTDGKADLVRFAKKFLTSADQNSPPWLKNYELPRERVLSKEIDEIEDEISRLKELKEKKQTRTVNAGSVKFLISAKNNYQLLSSLRKSLSQFGFEPTEGKSGIDLILPSSSNRNLAIKVGAKMEGPVGLEPYHQLVRGINDLKIFENEDPQGVLVVNGFAKKDLQERGRQVAQEVEVGCDLYGFNVVTTEQIFNTIMNTEFSEKHPQRVKDKLVDLFCGQEKS